MLARPGACAMLGSPARLRTMTRELSLNQGCRRASSQILTPAAPAVHGAEQAALMCTLRISYGVFARTVADLHIRHGCVNHSGSIAGIQEHTGCFAVDLPGGGLGVDNGQHELL